MPFLQLLSLNSINELFLIGRSIILYYIGSVAFIEKEMNTKYQRSEKEYIDRWVIYWSNKSLTLEINTII